MVRVPRLAAAAAGGALTLAACAASSTGADDARPDDSRPDDVETVAAGRTAVEDYPDAIARTLDRMATAPRPVAGSAMPPRHLDAVAFPTVLVDRSLIVSGGPPPDGIPPIDEPRFETADTVDWLAPDEPVIVLALDGEVRAYPIQVLIWHEIVNDVVAGRPVTVTYCPLCSSAVAFDGRLGDDALDFGTSGALYQANLVMYDRQTESLWTQFDGRAVVGTRVGDRLTKLPVSTVSWRDFVRDHPNGSVLSRDGTNPRPYGRNPYGSYERRETPVPGFFTGEVDSTLAPFDRIVGVELDGAAIAVPTRSLAEDGVVTARLGAEVVMLWHLPGTMSPLDGDWLASGTDIGSTAAFRLGDEPAAFRRTADLFVDEATGSSWNILGEAVAGARQGDRLEPVVHVDTFWFAWATYQPDATVVDPAR